MSNKDKNSKSDVRTNRREMLKKSAITGGALWGFTGVGTASKGTSGEAILASEEVQSIRRAVPGLQLRADDVEVTAVNPNGSGESIRVAAGQGTLYAAELPNGKVVAVFRFPHDAPRRGLAVDAEIPPGAKAMLLGSSNGARLVRSAGRSERKRILRALDLPDEEHVRISKSSADSTFRVSQMEFDEGRFVQTVVEPRGAAASGGTAGQASGFDVVGESVMTAGSDSISTSAYSCDCGFLVANIIMCFHSLGGCKTALGCGAFGGPYTILACAIATGCIYAILSEMFLSDAPGCVNLGRDIWEGCAYDCIPDL